MTRQDVLYVQLLSLGYHVRPVADVPIRDVVVRSVNHRVPRTQNLVFWQVHEAVAACVRPSKEMELRAPAAILDHVGRFREGFLRRFGGVQAELSYVLPLLRRSLPTLRFVALAG